MSADAIPGRDVPPLDVPAPPSATAAAMDSPGRAGFPYSWWRLVDFRIGIIPLPIYLALLALIAGFVVSRPERGPAVPSDILMSIVLLAVGGFTCAEIGKRIPVIQSIGGAAPAPCLTPASGGATRHRRCGADRAGADRPRRLARDIRQDTYSGAEPDGERAGGRCRTVMETNAPIHEPIAAKPT